MRVLSVFASAEHELGFSEIAMLAELDKPATQRCVHTLVQLGYLEKDARSGRFTLGKRVLDLSFHYLRSHPLVRAATPVLLQLRKDCGERTNLSLFDGTTLVYAIRLHGKREYPQYSTLVGRRVPCFCSAGGRAMLSLLPDDEVRAVIAASQIAQLTAETLTDPEAILDRVRLARERGYGFVVNEFVTGEITVAAPVSDASGRPVAAVHIAGSVTKWNAAEYEERFAPFAIEAARSLSHDGQTLWQGGV